MDKHQPASAIRLPPRADAAGSNCGFVRTIAAIAARMRELLGEGATAHGLHADRDRVVALLNAALASEIVCVLRYRRHYFATGGTLAGAVKKEFLRHSQEEQAHADRLAERIIQLGGTPDFNPDGLIERTLAQSTDAADFVQALDDDLVAEQIAIDAYRELIRFVEDRDYTTRRLLESILSAEEQHAEVLAGLLAAMRRVAGSTASRPADSGSVHMALAMRTA